MKKRKLKIKNIIIACIILIAIVVAIILLINKPNKDNNPSKSNEIKYKEKITINVGDKLPSANDYIGDKSNGNIEWDNIDIEDNKVYYAGNYTGKIKFDEDYITIKLEVIDKEDPIIEVDDNIVIQIGTPVDLLSYAKFSDNSHDELKKEVIGEYNLNKSGDYEIEYSVEDSSGNKATKKVTLTIRSNTSSNSNIVSNVTSNNNTTSNSSATTSEGVTTKGYKIENKDGLYYIGGILVVNKTYDVPSTYNPGGLVSEFNIAFSEMKKAAAKDGVDLKVVSGLRTYATQTRLYNNYVARDGKAAADRYSARPGHSEHQTGLAADLNEISDTFGDTKAGKWLSDNCWKYGFILRYPKGKESITGYMYESWHFRYIGDVKVTEELYNNGNWTTLEEYLGIDSVYK